jgi:flagellar basal body rod protein FlgF
LDNFPSDEELERLKRGNIPESVLQQETDAIKYFEEKNEEDHLKVVEHVKKLRVERKITYKDL